MAADEDMRDRIERVEAKVDDLQRTLTDAIARQSVHFEGRLVGEIRGLELRLDARMQDLEGRLGRRFQAQTEELRELLMTFADNYGGVLESIQRDLATLNKNMDVRFSDHDRLLATHDRRLRALERLERRQRGQTPH